MSDEPILVKQYLRKRCIGYSSDFRLTFFEDTILCPDDSVEVIWTTVHHGQDKYETQSRIRPTVDKPAPNGGL
jgi:hypothetical protein